ncbi:hypothetical protein SAMN04487900_101213 [Prevotella communis]|uniref:Uncharacterized protein n=2 Tax=Prevotella communis TaxID=2913614 RepID=A0A1H0D154_9BACT|nr:hypothetical protein SAMN04487900_101213 [Prevotella communis]
MAADSAVTVTNGDRTKIYNTATKIFRMSLDNPVGVMMFSSTEFIGTPWDVIFKLYRDTRGKQSFNTLEEYAKNFVDFLSAENYFSSVKSQKDYFISELSKFYYTIRDEVIDDYQRKINDMTEEEASEVDSDEILHFMLESKLKYALELYSEKDISPEFEDYTIDNLSSYGNEYFKELMELCEEDHLPTDMQKQWEESFLAYIRSQFYYNGSGIVFVGYGSKDIYPSLLPIYISGAFDHRLRYYFDHDAKQSVTTDDRAFICPFAQTDVMMTLMKGVAPDMFEIIDSQHKKSMQKVKDNIVEKLKESNVSQDVIDKVVESAQDKIQEEFQDNVLEYIQEEYIDGIIDAVDSFSIADMANMGESLISVTNLQRHISSSDESVGGPIDVAVITRSEGFIWIKHKDWFRQDLNPNTRFFE